MTDEQLFGKIFALLDSDSQGEREAALQQLWGFLKKRGKSFRELLGLLENNVPRQAYAELEQKLDGWIKAHDALAAQNASLVRRYAAVKTALWLRVNLPRLIVLAAAIAAGLVFYRLLRPVEDSAPAAAASAAEWRRVLSGFAWSEGDTAPKIYSLGGTDIWVLVRGKIDALSHSDARGQPIERHCLHLYAAKAERDAGAYLSPHPYNFIGVLTWSERAAECRMPGTPRTVRN